MNQIPIVLQKVKLERNIYNYEKEERIDRQAYKLLRNHIFHPYLMKQFKKLVGVLMNPTQKILIIIQLIMTLMEFIVLDYTLTIMYLNLSLDILRK